MMPLTTEQRAALDRSMQYQRNIINQLHNDATTFRLIHDIRESLRCHRLACDMERDIKILESIE